MAKRRYSLILVIAAALRCNAGASPRLTRRTALIGSVVTSTVCVSQRMNLAFAASANPRDQMLAAIASDASERQVLAAIESLVQVNDGSAAAAARPESLAGSWRLLWSAGADKFSPLLGLPRPIRPESVQQVGDGRVSNVLRFPLGLQARLSSGLRPTADASCLEIFPPFKLELLLGGQARTLVEAGSDAEFRALNARDEAAQAAPRNLYLQRYVETSGRPGDLRVSTVTAGDPVIVGSVFVHERL